MLLPVDRSELDEFTPPGLAERVDEPVGSALMPWVSVIMTSCCDDGLLAPPQVTPLALPQFHPEEGERSRQSGCSGPGPSFRATATQFSGRALDFSRAKLEPSPVPRDSFVVGPDW